MDWVYGIGAQGSYKSCKIIQERIICNTRVTVHVYQQCAYKWIKDPINCLHTLIYRGSNPDVVLDMPYHNHGVINITRCDFPFEIKPFLDFLDELGLWKLSF